MNIVGGYHKLGECSGISICVMSVYFVVVYSIVVRLTCSYHPHHCDMFLGSVGGDCGALKTGLPDRSVSNLNGALAP